MIPAETRRRWLTGIAGLVPAIGFAVVSLIALLTPVFVWSIAAWAGVCGLWRAVQRPPYRYFDRLTSGLLLAGLAAMLPVNAFLIWQALQGQAGSPIEALGIVALACGPSAVALHYVYHQLALLLAGALVRLATGQSQLPATTD